MAIVWTDLAELAQGRGFAPRSSRVWRKVEGRRACEPPLRPICLLFEPPRQFLVTHRDCVHHIASVRVGHAFGFCQNFLGARPQVANTRKGAGRDAVGIWRGAISG